VLGLLAAIGMIAPVDLHADFSLQSCTAQSERASCCSVDEDAGVGAAECGCCCCENGGTHPADESSDSKDGCKSGQCNCNGSATLCGGHAMPFLAPVTPSRELTVFVLKLPIPDLGASGDACLRGVFHPPRR